MFSAQLNNFNKPFPELSKNQSDASSSFYPSFLSLLSSSLFYFTCHNTYPLFHIKYYHPYLNLIWSIILPVPIPSVQTQHNAPTDCQQLYAIGKEAAYSAVKCADYLSVNYGLLLAESAYVWLYGCLAGGSAVAYNNLYCLLRGSMDKRHDRSRNMGKRAEDLRYCRGLKEFLRTFKTEPCPLEEEHRTDFCPYHHSPNDRRRNPYSEAGFLYYLEQQCFCDSPICPHYHSQFEYSYHPLVFKTAPCTRSPCELPPQTCWMLHKGESSFFEQGEFFRFDIASFKTMRCNRTDQHERKVCLYYHNEKDRRRPNFNDYSHIPCQKSNCSCERSHNKIEQLYHPTRYKTKFCQFYHKDPNACDYRDFCSFAHSKEEILITIIDPSNTDPNYIVSTYKTVWCPYTQDHDRGDCPYAHNIQDYRRKPSVYNYKPEKCPHWDFLNKIQSIEASECPAGMNCNKCHGWMEHRFHPLIYKAKGVVRSTGKKEQIFQKKLSSQHQPTKKEKEKESSIEPYIAKEVETNKAIYSVGAPFFKNEKDPLFFKHQKESERQFSKASNQTKPKTGNQSNLGSQNSFIMSSSKEKPARKGIMAPAETGPKSISSVYFQSKEHELWECDSVQHSKERNSDGRSKSQGNSTEREASYTHSIKDFVNDDVILSKLSKEKVSQLSLINMNDKKVDGMGFLSHQEKETLQRRLKEYHMRIKRVEYSRKLTKFFMINKAEGLLSKLQQRKAKEEMIPKLKRPMIKDLSFLNEEEKELLPKLLRKYGEDKEFDSLMEDVQEYVNQPTQEVQKI